MTRKLIAYYRRLILYVSRLEKAHPLVVLEKVDMELLKPMLRKS